VPEAKIEPVLLPAWTGEFFSGQKLGEFEGENFYPRNESRRPRVSAEHSSISEVLAKIGSSVVV